MAQEPGAIKKQILEAWQSAYQSVTTAHIIQTVEFYQSRDGLPLGKTRVGRVERVVTPQCFLLGYTITETGTRSHPENSQQLEITNSRYRSTISQPQPNGDWILIRHEPDETALPADRLSIVLPWTVVANVPLVDWLSAPQVVVQRVERIANQSTLRLHFVFQDEGQQAAASVDPTLRSGFIDFDDSVYHRVLGYQILRNSRVSNWIETGSFQYERSDGLPVLEKVTIDCPAIRSEKLGLRRAREIMCAEIVYNEDVPDERFWHSHYGLPEPTGTGRESLQILNPDQELGALAPGS